MLRLEYIYSNLNTFGVGASSPARLKGREAGGCAEGLKGGGVEADELVVGFKWVSPAVAVASCKVK